GLTKATGPILNYEGIDTSSYQTNINFKFKNRDRIREVRVGNKVDSIFTPQDRYSCGYFQNVNIPFLKVLTVKYLSFEAVVNNKIVDVKWVTNSVQNNAKFEVERSFDMNHFKMIGTVTNIVSSTEANISYKLSDVSKELEENTIVYYRLKQINLNGTWNYSKVISVELKPKIGIKMNVSPNPFVEDIHVHLSTSQSSIAEIRIISTSGQKKISKQFTVNKGESNIEIGSLNKLAMGLYVAQVIVNGTVIGNQQIIKN
ncbi:MAG: T9SS type A sorting domain-containing protein, partial [Ferruginibacter sp.]